MKQEKKTRLLKANILIATIASCGRNFFASHKGIAHFTHEKGRIYFVDDYLEERLPLTHTNSSRWRTKFTHGGTLKNLIIALNSFIKTARKIEAILGPWPEWYCNGDLWGYGEDMQIVRNRAIDLGIIHNTEKD
jgi:hypothetical protein